MRRYPVSRGGTLAVAQLPDAARSYAELPYSAVTEMSRQYHLRTYERWCAEHRIAPWPPTLQTLMVYAAERAQTKAFFTVREHLRNVCLVERKRSGTDLFASPALHDLLDGIKRDRPPAPVLPLRAAQIEALFSYCPTTKAMRNIRCILLLSYTAGFTLNEHAELSCNMLTFKDDGVWIKGLDRRPAFFVGSAKDPARCPVVALRALTSGRMVGPVYHSSRARSVHKGLKYRGIAHMIGRYGRLAGVKPLSNDRVRLAGMIEQSRGIDVVRLAHFHGYRHVLSVARRLGCHSSSGDRYRRQARS
jgi:integrase